MYLDSGFMEVGKLAIPSRVCTGSSSAMLCFCLVWGQIVDSSEWTSQSVKKGFDGKGMSYVAGDPRAQSAYLPMPSSAVG